MIPFIGALLLVLGLVSGIFLVLAPFGIGPASPGVTTWILYPGFTIVGYILVLGCFGLVTDQAMKAIGRRLFQHVEARR